MPGSKVFGAVPEETGTRFRVWALGRKNVIVEIEGQGSHALEAHDEGWFEAMVPGIGAGARYRYRLDGGEAVPDLGSRCQPDGNGGASMVVSDDFAWTDADWTGPKRHDEVLYELHIGSFTQEGTWDAARERLEHLADLGVTVIQVMPVSTFAGTSGWGYDTTLLYAPFAPYGTPDAMRAFVDRAHALGIGVILDVVYNHVGLDDHYRAYSEHFFTDRYENDWGESFNFDGDLSRPVREFITGNAVYWMEAFHIDGLRLDAVQAMFDASDEHIVAELTRAVREAAAPRNAYVVVENQPQERHMIEPVEQGGNDVDGMYNDDFQHAVRVAATGHNEFYYRDYRGTEQEIVSALKYGFLYQGQRSDMRDKAYGTYNLETPTRHFIHFLENHDQVANSPRGLRLASMMSPARLRAITALLLLGPQTPMLFQGQEWGATNPFLYFFGITGDNARAVAEGRKKSLMDFPSVTDPAMTERLADPADPRTFATSKLDWRERDAKVPMLKLHRDLLAMRRSDQAFGQTGERRIDGAVLDEGAFVLRYFTASADGHRLLLCNLGRDVPMALTPEPLLAPPDGMGWSLDWSSEHPDYDGSGRRPVDTEGFWILPADTALVLKPEKRA